MKSKKKMTAWRRVLTLMFTLVLVVGTGFGATTVCGQTTGGGGLLS